MLIVLCVHHLNQHHYNVNTVLCNTLKHSKRNNLTTSTYIFYGSSDSSTAEEPILSDSPRFSKKVS